MITVFQNHYMYLNKQEKISLRLVYVCRAGTFKCLQKFPQSLIIINRELHLCIDCEEAINGNTC